MRRGGGVRAVASLTYPVSCVPGVRVVPRTTQRNPLSRNKFRPHWLGVTVSMFLDPERLRQFVSDDVKVCRFLQRKKQICADVSDFMRLKSKALEIC